MTEQPLPPDVTPFSELAISADALDVLAVLQLGCYTGYRDATGQAHGQVPLGLVELATIRLLERPSRKPLGATDEPVDVHSLVLSHLAEMLTEDLELPADPIAQIADPHWRLNGAQRLVWDPGSTERELARLEEVFEPFDDDLRSLCGVTAGQARAVLQLLVSASFGVWLEVLGVDADNATPHEALAMLAERVLAHGPLGVGRGGAQALTVTATAVADRVDDDTLTATAVATFLDQLVTPFGQPPSRFASSVARLRLAPVLDAGDVNYAVVLPSALAMAAAPLFEVRLRAEGGALLTRVEERLGDDLERRGLKRIAEAVRPALALRRVEFRGDGSVVKRDGLVVVDTVALAVEAKGGGLPPSARGGALAAQRKAFERLIAKGVRQGRDTLAALVDPAVTVTGVDEQGARVNARLQTVTRTIAVVITLEDLTTVTAGIESLLPPEDGAPVWIVHVDDLAWYAETLPLPAQLLHFAIVRGRIAATAGYVHVIDEADWFRMYLKGGWPGIEELLRKLNAATTPILGYAGTDRRGQSADELYEPPAAFDVLEVLDRNRGTGWLEASLMLLDLNALEVQSLRTALRDELPGAEAGGTMILLPLVPEARPDGAVHVIALPPGQLTLDESQIVSAMREAAPDATLHLGLFCASAELSDYVEARLWHFEKGG